jgi:signal transduction histidine kinase
MAMHALALAEQVRLARTATVEAAAAERLRLQRELHDELGPTLTGIAFRADAAGNLLRRDPDAADALIGEVRTELRAAVEDVRRIVHGLRPIELEDLGLVGALRQRLAGVAAVAVDVAAPDPMPPLSPAVELAAYRIVMEAITNVARHSDARTCIVTLHVDDHLSVAVVDDGTTRAAASRNGLGLRSIQDRAEELGGWTSAGPQLDRPGWAVRARLPLGG